MPRPSLYETLFGNFAGGFDMHQVSEENLVILIRRQLPWPVRVNYSGRL